MVRARARIDASDGLLDLHTSYAAAVAAMVKEGKTVMDKLQKDLVKRARGYG